MTIFHFPFAIRLTPPPVNYIQQARSSSIDVRKKLITSVPQPIRRDREGGLEIEIEAIRSFIGPVRWMRPSFSIDWFI